MPIAEINTQHSQKTAIHSPTGFEPAIPASDRRRPYPYTARPLGSTVINLQTFHFVQTVSRDDWYSIWWEYGAVCRGYKTSSFPVNLIPFVRLRNVTFMMLGIQHPPTSRHTVRGINCVVSKELHRTRSLGSPRKEQGKPLKVDGGDVTVRFSDQLTV